MIVAAALSPSLDLTYLLDTLRLGTIHRTPDVTRVAGGKALNLTRAATTVGARCTAVALLGGPIGRLLRGLLTAEGIEVVEVATEVETRICVSLASASTGELTEAYQEMAAMPGEAIGRFREAVEATVQAGRTSTGQGGWLALSGRTPAGSDSALADLTATGHACGFSVAVDAHGAALRHALEQRPDLVKINRYEAAELTGLDVDTELRALAGAVQEQSGGMVVLTDGSAGALALDGDHVVRIPGPTTPGAFPVGSGDSFLGGLLAALDARLPMQEALRLAAGCGAANAMTPGQACFDRRLAEQLAAQTEPQE